MDIQYDKYQSKVTPQPRIGLDRSEVEQAIATAFKAGSDDTTTQAIKVATVMQEVTAKIDMDGYVAITYIVNRVDNQVSASDKSGGTNVVVTKLDTALKGIWDDIKANPNNINIITDNLAKGYYV